MHEAAQSQCCLSVSSMLLGSFATVRFDPLLRVSLRVQLPPPAVVDVTIVWTQMLMELC